MAYRLEWHGDQVFADLQRDLAPALTEIGLRAEKYAKRRLQKSEKYGGNAWTTKRRYRTGSKSGKVMRAYAQWVKGGGRGLRTGTLRRSIHLATPGYPWPTDHVEVSERTPERGGQAERPAVEGTTLRIELGSGMKYARRIHQEHYNPTVNGYIVKAGEEVRADVPGILKKHTKEQY